MRRACSVHGKEIYEEFYSESPKVKYRFADDIKTNLKKIQECADRT